jgi:hypothetical protein
MAVIQKLIEKAPRIDSLRRFQPKIRGVYSAVNLKTGPREALLDQFRIREVISDLFSNLLSALFRITGCRAPLDGIGNTVELGGVAAIP